MAAPKGNRFWKLRRKNGRDKLFASPDVLWEEACGYFDWVDKHSWMQEELVKYQGVATPADLKLKRPYTLCGLCFYLGCSESYFRVFKYKLREKEGNGLLTDEDLGFSETIAAIEQVIRTQQLEGAMLGAFNCNIVRSQLDLTEKDEVVAEKSPLEVKVSDHQTREALEELKKKL